MSRHACRHRWRVGVLTGQGVALFALAAAALACSSDPAVSAPGAAGATSVAGMSTGAGAPGAGAAGAAGSSGGSPTTGGGGSANGGSPATGGEPAAAGNAGSGGGNGGSGGEAGPVAPVMRNGQWALDLGEVSLVVDAQTGGRITGFSLANANVLTGADVNPLYWGSTLWISPESDWVQPPPAVIDTAAYAAQASDSALVLSGGTYDKLGVSVTKTFSVDRKLGGFRIEYKLTNHKTTPIMQAPWEVTRVFPRGLTFFATGPTMSLSVGATLPTTNSGGITWFAYDMATITHDSKLYADSLEGWVAHVADGLLFVKSFGDLTAAQIAPKEADVELYTNLPHTYIEIEDQGAYTTIAPQASAAWSVTWFLRKLPAGLDITPGSPALAQLVRDTIAGH
jgi:hypothetical protein